MFDEIDNIPIPVIPSRHPNKNTYHNVHHSYHHHHHHYHRPINLVCKTSPTQGHIRHRQGSKDRTPCHISRRYHHHHHSNHYQRPLMGVTQGDNHLTVDHTRRGHRRQTMDHIANSQPSNGECHSEHQHLVSHNYCNHHDDNNIDLHGTPLSQNEDEKDQIEHRKIDQNGTHRHFNDGNGHECEKLDNKTIHNHRHFNNGNSHEHGELGDKTTRKHRHFNNGNSHGKLGDKTTRKHRHFNNGNIQDRQHRIGRHGQQNTTYVHHRFHDNSHQSWPDSQVSPSSYNNGQGDISNNIKDYNIIKDRKRHLDQGRHVETSQNDSHVQIPNKMSSFFVLYTFLTMAYSLSYRYMKTGLFSWPIYFILFSSLITLSPASSTSSPSSKLHINLVVAQSCDETFLQSLTSKVNTAVENFIQKESPSDEFKLTFGVFPQCDSSSVLAHLSDIFGNDTTNTVVALASYDIHASFIPLADIFQKAYIVCNNHVSNPGMTAPTFAPFPSFAQEALMLAKILDMYRWQNVYVMYTDFRYWLDFSTTLYYTLTSQQFNVTLAKVDTSVDGEATRILQNVGSRKVIVLLMDVSDQEKVLAAASSLSMTTKHAIFVFTDSPYDITSRSLVGLSKEDASLSQFSNDINRPDVSIFESVFVIGPSFPSQNSSQEKSANTRRKRHAVETQLTFHSEKAAADPSNTQFSNFLQTNDDIVVNNNEYKNDLSRQRNINNLSKNNISYENKSTKKEIENISTNDASTLTRFGQLMLKQNIKDEHGNAPGHSTVPEKHSENHKRRKDRDDAQKPSQNTKFLQFRSESQTGKHINDDDNGDYLPNRGDNDYFIDKANDYFFNVDKNADDDQQPLGDGDEIIEYRSKREIHDFKTVESDLDAVYDIVYLLALAAYDNYRGDQTRSFDSRYLISKLANISFTGATGRFGVGPDLQVNFDFAVYDFNTSSERFEPRIFWEAAAPSDWTLAQRQRITWPGRVVLPGDDCFKRVSGCDEGGFETAYILTIVIATIAVVFIVVFIVSLLKRYLTNKEMNKGPNKILMSAADLVFIYKKDVGKSSRTMMKSRGTLTEKENTPDIIRASDPASRSMPSLNDLNDFTQTARYNGDLVHVKELDIEGFEMKSKLLTYIRMLRDLRHENLNPYVGFMVERENKPALVMEYCSRGSLHDMVHNDDIKLDWDFKLSLLTDLVRGMRYLHSSPLKFHGHLTSHNCVIDSRFVLKITTYGVSGIMERCKTARTMEAKDCLWSAPELLRDPVFMQKGSDKGDTYAMAIIFQEVTLRSEPYSTTGLTPEEIVRKLKKPPPLIRPSVTPQAAPPQFIQIMKQCWAEMPEMRPSLDEVYDQFKKLTGGKKANIVDSMFKMLEKYSNDLEDIVAERTMQLEEEKKKTDQLLFRMLPSTVAEALKLGQTVPAETFSEVSIYFSDIVGFTTISAMSTPMQVVDLLNDLYTMFDATIDNYDVYKVETIGDAYMVASGLPIRNGNRHAGEISTMALMLLSQCGEFTIRHMPHVPLRLRIGLHTGSCVAGVVGLTMPRFCLFGDTVNTASRMESTGAAFRIHISEACKGVLDVLGGYNLVFRGKTELKGKGKQNTYWLVGKDGLDKELPEPPPLVGLESLLRHMESDAASQKPVGTVSPTKSTSAPDLASPATSPLPPSNSNNTLLPVPDNLLTSSSISQPAHLDNLETLHKDTCKLSDQNQISVVKADVHGGGLGCGQNDLVGGVINFNTDKSPGNDEGLEVDTDNRLVDETMDASMVGIETVKNEYNNHHSESNDSGFGSERKHSQGQEFNAGFQPSSTIPEKVKRNSSLSSMTSSSNRTSVISSSDVTLSHHVTLNCDGHEETLAPVSEV